MNFWETNLASTITKPKILLFFKERVFLWTQVYSKNSEVLRNLSIKIISGISWEDPPFKKAWI